MAEINLKTLTTGGGVSEIDVNFNGNLEGQADATIPLNVNLTDGVGDVTPTSVALTGNDLDIVVPAPVVPSGVLFQEIAPSQYTSYRTGDEGWRYQNGFFNYTPPTNPKVIAQLDYNIGANGIDTLKNPLVVNGVSNTVRFVDVFGAKATNLSTMIIDKLTGMAHIRLAPSINNWDTAIDNALAYSITLNSITFSDWYLASKNELLSIARDYAGINNFGLVDGTATLISASANLYSATTYAATTTSMLHFRIANYDFTAVTKGNTFLCAVYITNARNLITAP